MKLVIFGSTGTIGQPLVQQALEQGHIVTAFTRDRNKLSTPHNNLKIVEGDVLDPTAVEHAIQGQDAVVCVLGSGSSLTSTIRSAGTRQIIRAMEKTNVQRLICQSTLGMGDSWNNLNFYWKYLMFGFLLRKVFADHQRQEQDVQNSPLDWTLIRPSAFIDGDRTGQYRHGFPSHDTSTQLKISRADVADFILKQLSDRTYLRQAASLSY